ncbi:MAG: hypothetical protein RL235_582, partial [Chlamydiota bacterium]
MSAQLQKQFNLMRSSNASVEYGVGECVYYLEDPENGHTSLPDKALYQRISDVMGTVRLPAQAKNRSELLRLVDGRLRAVFVPKTLYSLIIVEAAIAEETKSQRHCPLQHLSKKRHGEIAPAHTDTCLHICRFDDDTPSAQELQQLSHLAFRVNALVLNRIGFPLRKDSLTENDIALYTDAICDSLRQHHKTFRQESRNWPPVDHDGLFLEGGSVHFAQDSSCAIRDDSETQVM